MHIDLTMAKIKAGHLPVDGLVKTAVPAFF
jgi:hypothetical protein